MPNFEERIARLETSLAFVEKNSKANGDKLESLQRRADEIFDVIDSLTTTARIAIKFLFVFGKIIQWFGGMAVAVGAVWALAVAYKSGITPKLPP